MPDELVPGVPFPVGQIAPYFLNCSGNSGQDGAGCGSGFSPSFSVTMPSVGLPQVSLQLPDFSGMTIEGLLKALEMIGISPCSFIDAVAGGVTDMMGQMELAVQNSIDQIADLPQTIVNGIATEAQTGIDNMYAGLDLSGFTCDGLIGGVNDAMTEITGLQNQIDALDSDVNNSP